MLGAPWMEERKKNGRNTWKPQGIKGRKLRRVKTEKRNRGDKEFSHRLQECIWLFRIRLPSIQTRWRPWQRLTCCLDWLLWTLRFRGCCINGCKESIAGAAQQISPVSSYRLHFSSARGCHSTFSWKKCLVNAWVSISDAAVIKSKTLIRERSMDMFARQ